MNQSKGSSFNFEFPWALSIAAAGMLARGIFISIFQTRAMLDAYEIIDFARKFVDGSAFDHSGKSIWLWAHWNPGFPLFLSPFVALFGKNDLMVASTARWTVALTCGTIGLLPFLIMRDVLSLRARVILSLLLALWPGQITFSGVILQDNIVIIPTVALACLTLRTWKLRKAYPVWSAIAFMAGVAIRQETFVTNLPLLVVPLGIVGSSSVTRRRFFKSILIIISAFLVLMSIRWKATGHFSIMSEHGGTSVLGAYSPGAHLTGYIDYHAFAATLDSRYVDGQDGSVLLRRDAAWLALQEALRRPIFHTIRIIGSIAYHLDIGDAGNLWWTFGNLPDPLSPPPVVEDPIPWTVLDASKVIPADHQPLASKVYRVVNVVIRAYQAILFILFLVGMVVALRKRWWDAVLVGSGFLLRLAFHGLTVIQPRFLLPGIALELLVVIQVMSLAKKERSDLKLIGLSLLGGILFFGLVHWSLPYFWSYVIHHDRIQRTYRFALVAYRHAPSPTGSWVAAKLRCEVCEGTINYLNEGLAVLRLLNDDPAPSEQGVADCVLEPDVTGNYSVVVHDSYSKGGFPDKVVLQVASGSKTLLYHDMANSSFSGNIHVPLGRAGPGERKFVHVQLLAVHPDRGPMWGAHTPVEIRVKFDPIAD